MLYHAALVRYKDHSSFFCGDVIAITSWAPDDVNLVRPYSYTQRRFRAEEARYFECASKKSVIVLDKLHAAYLVSVYYNYTSDV